MYGRVTILVNNLISYFKSFLIYMMTYDNVKYLISVDDENAKVVLIKSILHFKSKYNYYH